MKWIGFWLLLLLAVLVPATAAIATSMMCPTVSVAKAAAHGPTAQANSIAGHVAAPGLHARVAQAGTKPARKSQPAGQHADPCCDLTPCSQCSGCGSCAVMAAAVDLGAHVRPLALAPLPDGGGPRAEFLLSGQERPPRAS